MEQVEIDLRPRCDDDSLPDSPDHPIKKWYELLAAATAQTGRPIEYDPKTPHILKTVGYVDVCDYVVQLPLHAHGQWPPTMDGRYLGRIYHAYLIGNRKTHGSRDSAFEALSLAAFTRELGWTVEQWADFQEQIIDAISQQNLQVYHEL